MITYTWEHKRRLRWIQAGFWRIALRISLTRQIKTDKLDGKENQKSVSKRR
jgi:hypothetical protein